MKESQTLGGTSGSDSDSESLLDIEGGPCEQSTNPLDVKRMRRYTKNISDYVKHYVCHSMKIMGVFASSRSKHYFSEGIFDKELA
jgi:hypothetical protein